MALINPAGTLARGAVIMGYSVMAGGENSVTIPLPLPGHDAYIAVVNTKGWQTTTEISQGTTSFTVTFSTSATADGEVWWAIILA